MKLPQKLLIVCGFFIETEQYFFQLSDFAEELLSPRQDICHSSNYFLLTMQNTVSSKYKYEKIKKLVEAFS